MLNEQQIYLLGQIQTSLALQWYFPFWNIFLLKESQKWLVLLIQYFSHFRQKNSNCIKFAKVGLKHFQMGSKQILWKLWNTITPSNDFDGLESNFEATHIREDKATALKIPSSLEVS